MSLAIIYFTLFATIILFLYNIYLVFFNKDSKTSEQAFGKWKWSLLIFILTLLLYIVYSGTAANLFSYQTTITDGTDTYTIVNNDYLTSMNFWGLMNALLLINFILLVVQVALEFQVFGRGRMKKRTFRGY